MNRIENANYFMLGIVTFFQHSSGFGDTPEMMGSGRPPLTTPEFLWRVASAESGATSTNVVRYMLRNGGVPTGPPLRRPACAKAALDQQHPVLDNATRDPDLPGISRPTEIQAIDFPRELGSLKNHRSPSGSSCHLPAAFCLFRLTRPHPRVNSRGLTASTLAPPVNQIDQVVACDCDMGYSARQVTVGARAVVIKGLIEPAGDFRRQVK
jgi:hypothetical protein